MKNKAQQAAQLEFITLEEDLLAGSISQEEHDERVLEIEQELYAALTKGK